MPWPRRHAQSPTSALPLRRPRVELATLGSGVKDAALNAIADALEARTDEILEANARDMAAGEESGLDAALLDRLRLDRRRVGAMAAGVRQIVALPDPVGEVIDGFRLPNGLDVRKVRVPLGVIAVVYEARPNVTIDAAALALKSGQRDRAARLLVRRALQRRARRDRLRGGDRGRPARGRAVARRRRRARGAGRAGDPGQTST